MENIPDSKPGDLGSSPGRGATNMIYCVTAKEASEWGFYKPAREYVERFLKGENRSDIIGKRGYFMDEGCLGYFIGEGHRVPQKVWDAHERFWQVCGGGGNG